jgi:hypothetical protein
MPVDYLRKGKDPWMGENTSIDLMLEELRDLVSSLNQWMPEPIDLKWDSDNHQAMVNKYHTHFPKYKDDRDKTHRRQLTRYNDIMHDIENKVRSDDITTNILVCPDAPHDMNHRVSLELEDYNLFTTDFKFGRLYMGYAHIGRHPMELYWAKDQNVPADQVLPQNIIGPIHFLYFENYKIDMEKFNEFYQNSGIEWPYALNDPRLAVGMIEMGELKTINDLEFRNLSRPIMLKVVGSCNKIVSWNIE